MEVVYQILGFIVFAAVPAYYCIKYRVWRKRI